MILKVVFLDDNTGEVLHECNVYSCIDVTNDDNVLKIPPELQGRDISIIIYTPPPM